LRHAKPLSFGVWTKEPMENNIQSVATICEKKEFCVLMDGLQAGELNDGGNELKQSR
jgi:hypothetical protein